MRLIIGFILVVLALASALIFLAAQDIIDIFELLAIPEIYILISAIVYLFFIVLLFYLIYRLLRFTIYLVIKGIPIQERLRQRSARHLDNVRFRPLRLLDGIRNIFRPQPRASQPYRNLLGQYPINRLIAFAITALILSDTFYSTIRVIINFFLMYILKTPDLLYQEFRQLSDYCYGFSDTNVCIDDLVLGTIQIWGKVLDNTLVEARFSPTLISQVFLFFLLWVILSQLLNLLSLHYDYDDIRERTQRLVTEGTIGRGLFVLLMLVGSYFSLVSIISIPILQEQTRDIIEVSAEKLQGQIDDLKETSRNVVLYGAESVDPFQGLTTFLEETSSESEANFINAANRLSAYQYRREQLLQNYLELQMTTDSRIEEIADQAVEVYNAETLGGSGSRETAKFYLDILNWTRDQFSYYENRVIQCSIYLRQSDAAFRRWSNDLALELSENTESETYLLNVEQPFERTVSSAESRCDSSNFGFINTEDTQPRRSIPGEDSGILGQIALWLLDTESVEQALIIGLLGFGILGAAASRYVRESQTSSTILISTGLIGIMLRGVIAAVLVFLITKSGLGIYDIGSGGAQINNPYLILLLCLIAGVYSEVVWAWAQKFIQNQLPSDTPPSEQQTVQQTTTEQDTQKTNTQANETQSDNADNTSVG